VLPSFSVVVPTFRRPDALQLTLDALAALRYPDGHVEVVVVDDGSGDATPHVVRGRDGVRLVQRANGGAAAARNAGAREATGDYVLFVDDDIIVESEHLMRHVAVHDRHPNALVNGEWQFAPWTVKALAATPFGRYRLALEEEFRAGAPMQKLADGCLRLEVIPSQDLSLRRELFWRIGGFDEDFPAAGAEDQEFSYRAREAGAMLLRDPSIRMLHNDSRVSLEDFCRREERSARTVPFLARRYPQAGAAVSYAAVNAAISRADTSGATARKLVKSGLAREPFLGLLRATIHGLERIGVSDQLLKRSYATLAGLHIFRGYRASEGGR
jgi:GT2 family glycosyltransferase